jgi:hypothetical protein
MRKRAAGSVLGIARTRSWVARSIEGRSERAIRVAQRPRLSRVQSIRLSALAMWTRDT